MTEQTPAYPGPQVDALSAPYWDGTRRGVLIVQRCGACGRLRHYPQVLCAHCYSDRHDWVELCGRGTVHSWTITHHAFHPAFAADVPYALVTADMEEGIRVLGRLDGLAFAEIAVGLPLRATFPPRPDGFGQLTLVPA
jgi:uncharacterized OB-fold protein